MFNLPFISVPKEILIPHPGNNYTITLNKTDEEILRVKDLSQSIENVKILYKNAFLIIIANKRDDFCEIAVMCSLLNKASSQESNVYHFSSIKKVKIISNDELNLNFQFIEPLKTSLNQLKNYNSLISFIKTNSYLKHIADNVNLNNDNQDQNLDQIINYLYPNVQEDYAFFNSNFIRKKITIINSLIINYHSDFKKSQPLLYPQDVLDKLNKEETRRNNLPETSAEYSNTLDYIEVLKSLPWNDSFELQLDVFKIEKMLSETHLGLQNVKDAVADHFAFQQLTGKSTGSYMLFDGPPGTGKTSIAKTIAKATNRDFISIALGGISDEAEIRGHRRTYLGSRPGRFISAMQKINSNNPVILLDELDKISSSNKGDPYSALLELLDPEQNSTFVDKYLEVPYDFSKAFIICTSNNLLSIPEPLRDRLSIIKFQNYSIEERYLILTEYILPDYLIDYNLETYNIDFSDKLLNIVAKDNNLRQMKRIILRLLKYAAKEILSGSNSIYLGVETYYNIYKKEKENSRIGF